MNNDKKALNELGNSGLFDMILTSIPFGDHYEYSTHYNDFGHNAGDAKFWEQMNFLTPNLLKVLKPGRIAAVHVKDRILYGHQTPHGFMEVAPFSHECQFHFRQHGFLYMGCVTIVTDVVRENNSTYRLGWTEMSNDGTKMGVGLPEYVLIFRKAPTSNENQRADEPVTKVKSVHFVCVNCGFKTNKISNLETLLGGYEECLSCEGTGKIEPYEVEADLGLGDWVEATIDICKQCKGTGEQKKDNEYLCPGCMEYSIFKSVEDFEYAYSRGRWQVDAHSFWRSDGNRPLTKAELYNYEQHVSNMEHLESKGNLPAAFMYDAPDSFHESTWTDVQFMQGLNANQSRKRQEQHLCPLPFDVVKRLIRRYSNEGDTILEPFAGLGTVPYCATQLKRKCYGIELWGAYYQDGLKYNQEADLIAQQPTMFDLLRIK